MNELRIKRQARVLSDSAAARGTVKRAGSGRVKHLEARWLWIQERVRCSELNVDVVDTLLNTSDRNKVPHDESAGGADGDVAHQGCDGLEPNGRLTLRAC